MPDIFEFSKSFHCIAEPSGMEMSYLSVAGELSGNKGYVEWFLVQVGGSTCIGLPVNLDL